MVEAALGTTATVRTPGGDVDVELPAGTQPHDVVVVRGRGLPSLRTGRPGDLRVHADVRVPRRLSDAQREQLRTLGETIEAAAYEDDDGLFARLKSAFR
jgi:molecular chaperone DnaJ